MPRIEERYTDLIDGFEAEGKPAVVVEYSVFRNRQQSLAYGAMSSWPCWRRWRCASSAP